MRITLTLQEIKKMTSIWKQPASVDILSEMHRNTVVEYLGIEFLEVGDDFIRGRIAVDHRTVQPMGVLQGGVSVVLAEALGSCGAALAVPRGTQIVGLDINANHLRGVDSGWVTGEARPLHLGRTTHVWEIKLRDERDRLVCVARLTVVVMQAAG